jgi:CheY-like chemotaxis protein
VRCAEDGYSALQEIRRESPEILLFDLKMPRMSGFELLINVRRSFPAIQVIAASGSFSGNEVPGHAPRGEARVNASASHSSGVRPSASHVASQKAATPRAGTSHGGGGQAHGDKGESHDKGDGKHSGGDHK